jgi:membrane peptidoglycan carboxypeptidase
MPTKPRFPIAVMGKTGTTNEFRDAIFVGSTYGPNGITAAIRIGFDDNRSLGSRETGGRLALPVFQELGRRMYPFCTLSGEIDLSWPVIQLLTRMKLARPYRTIEERGAAHPGATS